MKSKYLVSGLWFCLLCLCSLQAYATKGLMSNEAAPHFSSLKNQETIEDMRVKILGGFLRMNRSWNGSAWEWNQRWKNLSFTKAVNENAVFTNFEDVLFIYRDGQLYRKSPSPTGAIVFENQLNQFISKTASGFEWTDRKGNGIYYDLAGKATGYYDRNNIHVYFEFDSSGYLSQIKDNNHNVVMSYTYEAIPNPAADAPTQRLVKLTDYSGRSVSYLWNAANRLEKVTDVRGQDWTYTYSDSGLLTQLKDPEDRVTRYEIELKGKFTSRYDADGRGVTYHTSYDQNTELYYQTQLEGSGRFSETWYNAMGQIVRQAINGEEQEQVTITLSDNSPGVAGIMAAYSHRVELFYSPGYTDNPLTNKAIYIRSKKYVDARGNATLYEFNQWKNLLKVTYPDGTTTGRTWHSKFSLPLTVTDEKGVVTVYEYDEKGNLLSVTEAKDLPEQRITRYTYDELGQVTSEATGESAANNTAVAITLYNYDGYGNITDLTDAEGKVTHYSDYDAVGNARTLVDARASEATTQYAWHRTFDAAGDLLTDLDPYGKGTTYTYSKSGDALSVTQADDSALTYTTNASGLPLTITDSNGKVVKQEYNKINRPTLATDANGNKTQILYDERGRLDKILDAETNTTKYHYGYNLLQSIEYPTYKTVFDYNSRDDISTATQQANSRNYVHSFLRDKLGNISGVEDAQGNSTAYEYDSLSRVIKITDAHQGVIELGYDARDNVVQVKDQENRLTIYGYDRNNRLQTETKGGDQNTARQRHYFYDANGNTIAIINPEQEKTAYEYDRANRPHKALVFAHKDHTQPVKVVNYSLNTKSQLENWNQQLSSSLPEGVTPTADIISLAETYTYNNLGQLDSVTANFGSFSKTYSYSYYPNGLRKTYTNPENITYTYYYNKSNQLIAVHIPNNGQISYGDFNWAMPQTLLLPGGQQITYSYNDFLQVKERFLKSEGQQTLASAVYEYDLANNIKKILTQDGDYNFIYDNLYRLTNADTPTGNVGNNETYNNETYSYDKVGNRTNLVVSGGGSSSSEAFTHNQKNQLVNGSASTAFTYTLNGHTKTQTKNGVVTEYLYNHEERLIAVKRAGVIVAEYAYNTLGQRVKKTANGEVTWYLYNQNGLAAEYNSVGNLLKEYQFHPQKTWMTDPLFMRTAAGEIYYYYNDHLGTPQQLLDSAGQVVWQAKYTAFGDAKISVAVVENNLRFAGQYSDRETGLYYNYFRDYDPSLGRYIESDPIGLKGGINTYTYVKGNPLMFIDSFGLAGCYVGYPGYPITIPGTSTQVPLTHAGVLSYDAQGLTRYYEYGRYGDDFGKVQRQKVPDLEMGPDGKPTPESWKKLMDALNKIGHGTEAKTSCDAKVDADKINDFAEKRMNDPKRAPYSWSPFNFNTCTTFANGAMGAGLK